MGVNTSLLLTRTACCRLWVLRLLVWAAKSKARWVMVVRSRFVRTLCSLLSLQLTCYARLPGEHAVRHRVVAAGGETRQHTDKLRWLDGVYPQPHSSNTAVKRLHKQLKAQRLHGSACRCARFVKTQNNSAS